MIKSTSVCPECGNTLWDVVGDIAKCGNCHYERAYHRRTRGTSITPSQHRAIEHIKAFFLRYASVERLAAFEVKNVDGIVWVTVRTHENPFLECGGHFQVGRRGGIGIASIYDLVDDKKETARFYAKYMQAHLIDWAWD